MTIFVFIVLLVIVSVWLVASFHRANRLELDRDYWRRQFFQGPTGEHRYLETMEFE